MALSVIWLSVILGAALGLWQRITTRATGPIRTFAVVAATLVVGLSLLPHAIESEGLWGLVAAAGGLALIPALDRLVRFSFRDVNTGDLRLEVGFIGLSVHRFGDGVVMAVDGHGNDLLWAVGAHEVPIVALVTLVYARRGIAEALVRAMLLGLVSSLGYWLVRVVPATGHDLHGWADAIAAGILLHIVADTGLTQELRNVRERTLDVLGGLSGMALVLLPGSDHAPEPSFIHRILAHALDTVPWLGVGLLASAALAAAGVDWARARPNVSVFLVAFGSALGLECVALSAHLLGGPFAVLGAAGALTLGTAAAVAASTLGPVAHLSGLPPGAAALPAAAAQGFGRRWWALFEERLFRVGGWFLLGLLGASYIDAFALPGALEVTGTAAQAAIGGAIGIAAFICPPAVLPLVASLVFKGLEPGVALAGLLLGPAARLLAVRWPKEHLARARWFCAVVALAVLAWGIGALANRLLEPASAPAGAAGGALEWVALVALSAVLARRIWHTGIRSWMGASLTERLGEARRDHPPLELHAH
jgi:uncharacterized protein